MIHCFLIICFIECMSVEASIADLEISLSGFPNETDGRYSFSDSETLNLICAIKKDDNGPAYGLHWFFDGEFHVGKQTTNNTHVLNIISLNITESDDGKKIKCKAKEKRAINDHSVPKSEESDDSKLKREVELIFYEPRELLPAASTFEATNLWIYAAIIASAILALISIVSCVASIITSRTKKKKKMTPKSNEENEINFSQFQRRIEQSNQSTECLYTEPTDSRKSNYAASKSIIYPTNDVYTVPYKPKDVCEMYAKPIPKAYRKKEAGLHYAEIGPKENSKGKPEGSYYNNVERNELNASENADNINEYDYVKAKNAYYNVFNGESYVNAKSNRKDEVYSEPAYCEVAK